MAVIANRRVDLLPGWSFQPGERVPTAVWDGLGKAKQRSLLAGRFFMLKHGKAAESIPAPAFQPVKALPPQEPIVQHTPVVWPEYEPVRDTAPSLRELVGLEPPAAVASPVTAGFPCSECSYIAASKQALGGHRRGHAKQKARQTAAVA